MKRKNKSLDDIENMLKVILFLGNNNVEIEGIEEMKNDSMEITSISISTFSR